MIKEPVILKTDRLGRVRTPVAQREALLDAFERSGLSGMKFAELHGVKYPSFANWVQQRKRRCQVGDSQAGGAGGSSVQWWEAVVDRSPVPADRAGTAGGGLRLELPGGLRMGITAADQVGWAAQLVRTLAAGRESVGQPQPAVPSC